MTIFIIIMQLVILILLLSMIYSMSNMNQNYRSKLTKLTQDILLLEHKLEHLERKIVNLEGEKDGRRDAAE